ncbi:NAD(P)-binding domain-containing protein [Arthrobacter sp. UYP6]|uniref:NAD(P)-binding domain-containing protein n=1 Tax=Arthrobacter sp. UYP6 TaxID=1756378 RepID=UPI003392E750
MDAKRTDEIWILGATGNVGRALAGRLTAAGISGVVLVGRSTERLAAVADTLDGSVRTQRLAGFADPSRPPAAVPAAEDPVDEAQDDHLDGGKQDSKGAAPPPALVGTRRR